MILSEEEQSLVNKLKELRPDLVVVPRKASSIMCLRGSQHGPVFEKFTNDEPVDFVKEFFDFSSAPNSDNWDPDPKDWLHEDRREYILISAIWDGCIKGFDEWQNLREKEGSTRMVESWDSPLSIDYVVHSYPFPDSDKSTTSK